MATRPTATIQRIRPPKGRLVFYEDNIIDGRVPIEMMQSNAIKQALAALDHLPDSEESAYIDSNLPIRFVLGVRCMMYRQLEFQLRNLVALYAPTDSL